MPTRGQMARYKELRATLAREISAGRYKVGDRFPTDLELSARFRVSRHTVREAVRGLQELGLLSRQAGSGTVVRARSVEPLYTQRVDSLAELAEYAADTRLDRRQEGFVVVRQGLAELMGRPPGERWLRVAGIRRAVQGNFPLCWTEIFLAERYAGMRDRLDDGDVPIFNQVAREYGLDVTAVEQRISAIAMPPYLAEWLGAAPAEPALLVRRSYYSGAGAPFEVSLSVHPGDRYAYTARLTRDRKTENA